MSRLSSPSKGPDPAGRDIDNPHAVVGDIGNEKPLLRRVETETVRFDHPGLGSGAAIAGIAGSTIAGKRRCDARRGVDAAHAMIVAIGDVNVAVAVDGDAIGLVE